MRSREHRQTTLLGSAVGVLAQAERGLSPIVLPVPVCEIADHRGSKMSQVDWLYRRCHGTEDLAHLDVAILLPLGPNSRERQRLLNTPTLSSATVDRGESLLPANIIRDNTTLFLHVSRPSTPSTRPSLPLCLNCPNSVLQKEAECDDTTTLHVRPSILDVYMGITGGEISI